MSVLTRARESRGLSLDGLASELSLKSKGFLSRVENGEPPSLEVAIRIQVWSGGEVQAAELLRRNRPAIDGELAAFVRTFRPPAAGAAA